MLAQFSGFRQAVDAMRDRGLRAWPRNQFSRVVEITAACRGYRPGAPQPRSAIRAGWSFAARGAEQGQGVVGLTLSTSASEPVPVLPIRSADPGPDRFEVVCRMIDFSLADARQAAKVGFQQIIVTGQQILQLVATLAGDPVGRSARRWPGSSGSARLAATEGPAGLVRRDQATCPSGVSNPVLR